MASERAMSEIVHGGIDYGEFARLGIDPAGVIDFSVNGNPYGASPHVREALQHVDIAHYPDRHCLNLRQAILEHDLPDSRLSLDRIVCGNGTAELIMAAAHAFLEPGEKAAIIGPTYGDYVAAVHAARAIPVEFRAEAPDFGLDSDAAATWIVRERPALVWVCNPNNPTGHALSQEELRCLVDSCQSVGARLILDEAYQRFLFTSHLPAAAPWIHQSPSTRIIVLRSLTKDYALPGLRLGYLIGDRAAGEAIARQLPSWNVSAAAQMAGIAALNDQGHLRRTLTMLHDERDAFFAALREARLAVAPSQTHFCLVDVGDARAVRRRLLASGLLVRDCTSFGLPRYIRVATRPEWPQLIDALIQEAQSAAAVSPLPDTGRGTGG
jgi:histidinol-phosphate aminotransferase